jgi:hypothetical protein
MQLGQRAEDATRTWLAESTNLTPREAARLIKAGQGLQQFPLIATAAPAGTVRPAQCSSEAPYRLQARSH